MGNTALKKARVVILTTSDDSGRMIYNSLCEKFEVAAFIVEENPSRITFLQRRISKLGFIKVVGQVLFQIFIPRILSWRKGKRIREIKSTYKLKEDDVPKAITFPVASANSAKTKELIFKFKPDAVIVSGTRILSKDLIKSTDCPLINWHSGITPLYRGVHGGYWALVNTDATNCGVTVHLIDEGVDTGPVLFQSRIYPSVQDCFVTYPLLQLGEAIPLLENAVNDAASGSLRKTESASGISRQWYHPTIWEYLWYRLSRGVR